jgi:hypothetical protein
MKPGCIGKSNTNNLPAPTDLTENPYGKRKLVFNDATQKSASVVAPKIAVERRVTDDRGCCMVVVFGMVPHQSPIMP